MSDIAHRTIQGGIEVPGADILHGRSRAGDADRDRVIRHLSDCHRLGYLPAAAFHARMESAAQAPDLSALERLAADLPALPVTRPPLRVRVRRCGGTKTRRRWLHIAAAAGVPVLGHRDAGGPVHGDRAPCRLRARELGVGGDPAFRAGDRGDVALRDHGRGRLHRQPDLVGRLGGLLMTNRPWSHPHWPESPAGAPLLLETGASRDHLTAVRPGSEMRG